MEFSYQARNKEGGIVSGVVEAQNENEAVGALQGRGYVVLSLERIKKGIFEGGDLNQIFNRPKPRDVAIFTRQMSTLLEVDVPLIEGMRTLAQQTEKPVFARVINDVADRLEGGTALSGAFANHPKIFSQFFIKLIRSGEISGRLPQSLKYLADYLERNQALAAKVRNALAYPAFVVFSMAMVAILMVVYVLPQLLTIFEESGAVDLPITTRALIAATGFTNDYLVVIIILFLVAAVGGIQWSLTVAGRQWIDRFKIRAPLFGSIMRSLYLARIAENMSVLVKSDVAILDALRVTSDVVGNVVYRDILLQAEEQVRGGGSVSDVFRQYNREVAPLMASMVAIGERTGRLDSMLERVSRFYEADSTDRIDSIATLIEPVLVVVLGLGVATLVASVLLPLYSLMNISV